MSEPSSQGPKDEQEAPNPLDLSDLKSFSFGTEWTDAGEKPRGDQRSGSGRSPGQQRRLDRRKGGAGKQARDRRPFGERGPSSGDKRDGSRADFSEQGDRRESSQRRGQGRFDGRHGRPQFDRSYESPVFEVGFYPDDDGFATIIKALRTNHITYELFEVSRIFLEKSERYVASVTRKGAEGEQAERVAVAIPDGMPFETEEEAIQHVIANHVDAFFDQEEIETEPPSGNFPFVNRCGMTKKILGPPNYHRYEEFVNQHFQTQIGNASFERFQSAIVQDREEEAVNEWLESMKKTIRYSTKPEEGETVQTFDTLKEALVYLRTTQRDKIVKTVNYARVPGVTIDKYPDTEVSRAVSGELARQRRFPLKTANLIRGRLRRENFSIYKRGSKGVTYICAAKRNFRQPGRVMSDSLDRLIHYVELNAGVKVKELPSQYKAWLQEAHPDTEYDEKKLFQDLHWLIADGYISHFADDSLVVQPILDVKSGEEKVAEAQSQRVKPQDAPKAEAVSKPLSVSSPEGGSTKELEESSDAPVAASESVEVTDEVKAKQLGNEANDANSEELASEARETKVGSADRQATLSEVESNEDVVPDEQEPSAEEGEDNAPESAAKTEEPDNQEGSMSDIEESSEEIEAEPESDKTEGSANESEADVESVEVKS